MGVSLRIAMLLLIGLAALGASRFDAMGTTEERDVHLRVLDATGLGVQVLIRLSLDGVPETAVYTDWSGNAIFRGLQPMRYDLSVEIDRQRLYSGTLLVSEDDAPQLEVIRLASVTFSDQTETVSVNDLGAPRQAREYYSAGIKALRAGDLQSAGMALDEALDAYPSYSKGHNVRGVVFNMSRKTNEAEEAFRKAIQLDSDLLEPRLNLGALLLKTNRAIEATVELQKAFTLSPDNALPLLLKSLLVTHNELSAVSLSQSMHAKSSRHPVQMHTLIAIALAAHGMVDLAAEQYSLLMQDEPSALEGRQAQVALAKLADVPSQAIAEAQRHHFRANP